MGGRPRKQAGALVGYEHVVGHMKFMREWLQEQGRVAERCRLIRVTGNSMEPTLPDKTSILVDLSRTERRDGKISATGGCGRTRRGRTRPWW